MRFAKQHKVEPRSTFGLDSFIPSHCPEEFLIYTVGTWGTRQIVVRRLQVLVLEMKGYIYINLEYSWTWNPHGIPEVLIVLCLLWLLSKTSATQAVRPWQGS